MVSLDVGEADQVVRFKEIAEEIKGLQLAISLKRRKDDDEEESK